MDLESRGYSKILKRVKEIIESLNELCDEKSHDFVQSAPWADDIREKSFDFLGEWHYLDIPLNLNNLPITDQNSLSNAAVALKNAELALRNDNG